MALEALMFLPGVLLLLMANKSEHNTQLRLITKIFLFLSVLLVILNGFLNAQMQDIKEVSSYGNMGAYGYSMAATGFIALLLFLRPVRGWISQVIDVDPDNWLHTTALVFAVFLAGISLSTAAFTDVIKLSQDVGFGLDGILLQDFVFFVAAFFGVGWMIRRDTVKTLKRLGIVKPSLRDILYSFLFFAILFLVIIVSNLIASAFGLQPSFTESGQTDPTVLILGEITILKAILISIGAGVGEETLFRGALQPRFGMVLTSLLFVVMHVQYPDPFSMVLLFAMSMVFAYQKKLFNTTSCIITHTLYDMFMLLSVALM